MADSSGSYDRFISRRGRRRKISVIQELVALAAGQPGIISLAPGSVDPAIFPFQLIEAAVENDLQLRLEGEGLTRGLGYTGSYGHPGLLEQLEQRTRLDHQPPYPLPISGEGEGAGLGMRQVVGCGGHDLLSKVFDLLIDEGDPVLVEAPTFSGALAALLPLAPHLVGVTCNDRSGIDPTHLREILDQYKGAERRPRVLYTIPTGQNPTGATSSLEAKRAVYQLACEHDLLIIEDDPYFYLYFETEDRMMPAQPPSYLSLDVQHRVLRLDSLSKVLCPGLRIGWLTGPSQLVERVQLDMQATCMNPSNVSQALVHRLMVEWGREGWQRQVERLRDTYRKKRDSFEAAARKHLTNLCEWNHPAAGMFVWIRLIGVEDSRRLMEEKGIAKKVLFVPGEFFMPTNDDHHANEKQAKSQSQSQTIKQGGSYLRASYSLASPEDMDTALSRLADILREHRAQMTIIDTNKARA